MESRDFGAAAQSPVARPDPATAARDAKESYDLSLTALRALETGEGLDGVDGAILDALIRDGLAEEVGEKERTDVARLREGIRSRVLAAQAEQQKNEALMGKVRKLRKWESMGKEPLRIFVRGRISRVTERFARHNGIDAADSMKTFWAAKIANIEAVSDEKRVMAEGEVLTKREGSYRKMGSRLVMITEAGRRTLPETARAEAQRAFWELRGPVTELSNIDKASAEGEGLVRTIAAIAKGDAEKSRETARFYGYVRETYSRENRGRKTTRGELSTVCLRILAADAGKRDKRSAKRMLTAYVQVREETRNDGSLWEVHPSEQVPARLKALEASGGDVEGAKRGVRAFGRIRQAAESDEALVASTEPSVRAWLCQRAFDGREEGLEKARGAFAGYLALRQAGLALGIPEREGELGAVAARALDAQKPGTGPEAGRRFLETYVKLRANTGDLGAWRVPEALSSAVEGAGGDLTDAERLLRRAAQDKNIEKKEALDEFRDACRRRGQASYATGLAAERWERDDAFDGTQMMLAYLLFSNGLLDTARGLDDTDGHGRADAFLPAGPERGMGRDDAGWTPATPLEMDDAYRPSPYEQAGTAPDPVQDTGNNDLWNQQALQDDSRNAAFDAVGSASMDTTPTFDVGGSTDSGFSFGGND